MVLACVTSYCQVSFLSSLVGRVGGVIYLNSGNIQVEAPWPGSSVGQEWFLLNLEHFLLRSPLL